MMVWWWKRGGGVAGKKKGLYTRLRGIGGEGSIDGTFIYSAGLEELDIK